MTELETLDEPRTVSWKVALTGLLVVPCVLAFLLKVWLGVSSETDNQGLVFERLGLASVSLEESVSYQYGNLFFTRFRVSSKDLASLERQLESWSSSQGLPKEPVSFKLKREWWDMDQGAKGQGWDRDRQHLFRPDSQPNLFYGVVELSEATGP